MSIVLPAIAVAFAAFCVWLAVRIVNRREKWARWTLVAVVGLPVLYVASFGPACGLIAEGYMPINSPWWRIYCPLAEFASSTKPSFGKDMICRWASVWDGDVGLAVLVFTLATD
jgi:hypothetical protein